MIRGVKLPDRKRAYIPKGKLINYLLSETHPVGSAKAKFFRGLGFDETKIDQLSKALLHIVYTNDVKDVRTFAYGTNYLIEGELATPTGRVIAIATVWYRKTPRSRPSFVTAYPV